MNNETYIDGWDGFTKKQWDEMYDTNTAQWPVWIECSTGKGFDATATLRANGLHPDKIPELLRDDCGRLGSIIKKISDHITLTYIPTNSKRIDGGE